MQINIHISSEIVNKCQQPNIPQSKLAELHFDKVLSDKCGTLQRRLAFSITNPILKIKRECVRIYGARIALIPLFKQ